MRASGCAAAGGDVRHPFVLNVPGYHLELTCTYRPYARMDFCEEVNVCVLFVRRGSVTHRRSW